ncbi:hypothetical protein JOF57_006245 [Mycolicibacterium lutetiense]|uniref:Transposase n=1 Tax=Mycolicibacterium lutetiense TaxID=1641992 RepID=A0ABS5A3D9_9MYCO|nr:hypothetical protein [Mycolicibacterium lutetiense]
MMSDRLPTRQMITETLNKGTPGVSRTSAPRWGKEFR